MTNKLKFPRMESIEARKGLKDEGNNHSNVAKKDSYYNTTQ